MKKTILIILSALFLQLILVACSSNNPDEAGLKTLCKGKAIESAAPYDLTAGETMVALYVENEGDPYEVPRVNTSSMQDGLIDFVNTYFADDVEQYTQASLVLCLSAVDSEVIMSCGFKNEEGKEATIDYLATIYDINLYVAQTGELLDSTQIELGYSDYTCPTSEIVRNSQARFHTEIATKYTTQPKGYRDMFWANTADFLVPHVRP